MADHKSDELNATLSTFLHAAAALASVAQDGMSTAELGALSDAVDLKRAQIACTMLLPSGAVRIGVVGDWKGERCLWQMTPSEAALKRPTQ